jgi:uncharacterized protein YndB with AHSA1/START domain
MSTDRIQKKILLRAPRQRVWAAISDSSQFGTWFGMKFEAPFLPGTMVHGQIAPTKVDDAIAQKQKPYAHLKFEFFVDKIEPERLFSFRWHPYALDPNIDYTKEPTTLVEFVLEDAEEGILLTITESGFDQIPLERRAKAFQANESGWAAQTRLIEAYLANFR